MKKYITYIGLLIVGLLLGWLLFGNTSHKKATHKHAETSEVNQMWTCSMHPQIMKNEAGDCPICGMDLIPSETTAEGLNVNEFKLTKNAMALANIQTSIVGVGQLDGESSIRLSGKITDNEDANMVQVSYFSGRIERLYISSVGQEVKKGERLATVYSPELFAAQQELITAASLKETQPNLYKAVRNKLKLWKISEAQINEIELSGKVQENFPIHATVSGTVTEKMVVEGASVKQGQPILKISNLETVWGVFDVYETQLGLVKKGQEITVTTNAYPNKEFQQKIDFVNPTLNSTTRTVKLRVVLSNKKGLLKTGMFLEGKVAHKLLTTDKTLAIPATAILWTGKRSVVYVKTNRTEPVFEMREITLGKQLGEQYEVLQGLSNGDEIVTNGTFTVDAAAQLKGKKSMMNKEDGKTMTGYETHMMNESVEKIFFDVSVEKHFEAVIDAYINLKDAFVTSDISLISNKSEEFRKTLEQIPVHERGKTNHYWAILHKTSKAIHNHVDVTHQREQFQVISNTLIEMARNFENMNSKLFVQFCPMASNNKGAYWLSKESEIVNPYFGSKMGSCGKVTEVLK